MIPWTDTDDLIQCSRCLRWSSADRQGRRPRTGSRYCRTGRGHAGDSTETYYAPPLGWEMDSAGHPVCRECLDRLDAVAEHRRQVAEQRRAYLARLRGE